MSPEYSIVLDKLTICFRPDPLIQVFIGRRIDDMHTLRSWKSFDRVSFSAKGVYRFAGELSVASVYPGNQEKVLLQASPRFETAPFTRIDFNPSKISTVGWTQIEHLLTFFNLDPNKVFTEGIVTRLDVCLDFPGCTAEDVLARSKRKRKHTVVAGSGGVIESAYCGCRRGNHLIGYTKTIGKGPDARKVFRLEPRNTKARYPVVELAQQPNPFEGVSLIKVAAVEAVIAESVPMHLIDSIRLRGLKRALEPLSKEQRKRIKDVFADPAASLLPDTDELWKTWPDVLISCGLGRYMGLGDDGSSSYGQTA